MLFWDIVENDNDPPHATSASAASHEHRQDKNPPHVTSASAASHEHRQDNDPPHVTSASASKMTIVSLDTTGTKRLRDDKDDLDDHQRKMRRLMHGEMVAERDSE
jgi:hypothetical protein